jgi:RNA polymerase sigma factor (TIGR02999 family)
VYLRLVNQRDAQWQNRGHFFAVASQIIRRILIDHARRHQSEKRGSAISPMSLDDALTVPVQRDLDIVALDESLIDLAALDSRKSRVVELRFFGGLSVEEISQVLQIPPAAVKKEWTIAKAWLYRSMLGEAEG